VLPGTSVLTVLDIFNKDDPDAVKRITKEWQEHVTGEVFIP
jgi:hypothetical protein